MSSDLLKSLSHRSSRVMRSLVAGLDVGDARKVERDAPFMAVHVEALRRTSAGVLFSVAHYFEQNGDLVPDPDVVFLQREDGSFCAISFQNSIAFRQPVRWRDDGTIELDQREQAAITAFANVFLRNIAEQQAIAADA